MSASSSGTNGLGIGSVLFLIFMTLKLVGVIAWSWWWVTCPLWGPFGLAVLVLGGAAGMDAIAGRRERKWKELSQ